MIWGFLDGIGTDGLRDRFLNGFLDGSFDGVEKKMASDALGVSQRVGKGLMTSLISA